MSITADLWAIGKFFGIYRDVNVNNHISDDRRKELSNNHSNDDYRSKERINDEQQ